MIDQTKTNGSMADKANAAFERAAAKVIERARQTGTPVVVWEDDHVSELSPEHLTENRKPKTEDTEI